MQGIQPITAAVSKQSFSEFTNESLETVLFWSITLASLLQSFLRIFAGQGRCSTARRHGHSEQRTGPQANDTARTMVNSSRTTLTTTPSNQWLNKPGHRSSGFSDPTHSTLRPSPDSWPCNNTYDLPGESRLDTNLLDSLPPNICEINQFVSLVTIASSRFALWWPQFKFVKHKSFN